MKDNVFQKFTGNPCRIVKVIFFTLTPQDDPTKGAEVVLDWWQTEPKGEYQRRSIFVSRSRGHEFQRQLLAQEA